MAGMNLMFCFDQRLNVRITDKSILRHGLNRVLFTISSICMAAIFLPAHQGSRVLTAQALDSRFSSSCLPIEGPVKAIVQQAAENSSKISTQVFKVFRKYCAKCHHDEKKVRDFDILNHQNLMTRHSETGGRYLIPGDSENSELWLHVGGAEPDMPPNKQPQPSQTERDLLKSWIDMGAPEWEEPKALGRTRLGLDVLFNEIITDLQSLKDLNDRRNQRYFSLLNLHNDVTNDETSLSVTRAAVSKLMNSLSWKFRIYPPRKVGKSGILLAIDLRDYDWDEAHLGLWDSVIGQDPYRMNYTDHNEYGPLQKQIETLMGLRLSKSIWVRADWFIAAASVPPLYHKLLDLPGTLEALEKQLGVNTAEDFRKGRLIRAGFSDSGISAQNRVTDRHKTNYGNAYWKSFDFASGGKATSNILKFPFGPDIPDHPFPNLVFKHNGGEMIIILPGGLQAYYLADGLGRRLDSAPTDIVQDSNAPRGNVTIVNGRSCMSCHTIGMKRIRDDLRTQAHFDGPAEEFLKKIVPSQDVLDKVINADMKVFRRSLEQAVGPFVPVAEAESDDPIARVDGYYARPISLESLANELNLESVDSLVSAIKFNPSLKKYGLRKLLENDNNMRRVELENTPIISGQKEPTGMSLFQAVAFEMNLGIPVRPIPLRP